MLCTYQFWLPAQIWLKNYGVLGVLAKYCFKSGLALTNLRRHKWQSYHFKWAVLSDTAATHDVYIQTNNSYNYCYYNFGIEKEVQNEPLNRDNWDLMITTYKQVVKEETLGQTMPYILRGVLTNPNKVKVVELNNKIPFDQIDLTYAKALVFSNYLNEIGYDWKTWSLSANKYAINQNKVFIILDAKGNYFKMRFVDFYNDLGEKGYPKIAWELLK